MNLGLQQGYGHMWGTVGSGLVSGSRWYRENPDFRISGSGKSGKTGNPEKSHVTYQIKALCKLVNMDTLKSGFPDSRSGKSGKTGNPEKKDVTYQIEALGKLVKMDALKSEFPDFGSGKTGKTRQNHVTYEN